MKVVRFPAPADRTAGLRDVSTPAQLAEFLSVPVSRVYRWTHEGGGPAHVKLASGDRGRLGPAGSVRFRRADVDAWLEGLVVKERPRPKRRRRQTITRHQAVTREAAGVAS